MIAPARLLNKVLRDSGMYLAKLLTLSGISAVLVIAPGFCNTSTIWRVPVDAARASSYAVSKRFNAPMSSAFSPAFMVSINFATSGASAVANAFVTAPAVVSCLLSNLSTARGVLATISKALSGSKISCPPISTQIFASPFICISSAISSGASPLFMRRVNSSRIWSPFFILVKKPSCCRLLAAKYPSTGTFDHASTTGL